MVNMRSSRRWEWGWNNIAWVLTTYGMLVHTKILKLSRLSNIVILKAVELVFYGTRGGGIRSIVTECTLSFACYRSRFGNIFIWFIALWPEQIWFRKVLIYLVVSAFTIPSIHFHLPTWNKHFPWNICSDFQQISPFHSTHRAHCHVSKNPSQMLISSQMNPIYTTPSHLFQINFNETFQTEW